MKAPKYHFAEWAKVTRTIWVTEVDPNGTPSEIKIPEGMVWDRCEYRKEEDGTYTIKLVNNTRVKGIPPGDLLISVVGLSNLIIKVSSTEG